MRGSAASRQGSTRLSIRATRSQKRLFEAVASRQKVTLTDFILQSASSRAEEILAEQRRFALPPARWKAFLAALDRPVRPKPRLRRLLSEPTVLERR